MPRKNPLLGIKLDPTAEARAKEHFDHFAESLVTEAKSVAFHERDNIVLPSHIEAVLIFCHDANGDWWDWTSGRVEPLITPPPALPGNPEFRTWIRERVGSPTAQIAEQAPKQE